MRRSLAGGAELLEALRRTAAPAPSIAGFRNLRGSNSAGLSLATLRNWPVIAIRQSVSMLTLRTPWRMPSWISSTGTPQVWGIAPPLALITSCSSCGTGARAVHDEVRRRQALVDRPDHVHRQDVAGRRRENL